MECLEIVGIPWTPACMCWVLWEMHLTWDLTSAGCYLLSVQITILGDEQETAEGFEAVGSQLGAGKESAAFFQGLQEGFWKWKSIASKTD